MSSRFSIPPPFEVDQQKLINIHRALDESAIVAITDRRGVIVYVNDMFCSISQYSREELIGQTHRLVKSDEHPKEFFEDLWSTISGGRVWRGTIKNRAKDGSSYWMNATITPFPGADGRPDMYVAIRSDITAQKKLEQELRIAQEEAMAAARIKAEFLANISHEIRTPLNGILGMASLLEKTPLTPEQKHYAEIIQTSGDALLSMVNDVLDFSKIESEKMELEDIPFPTGQPASDVRSITSATAQRKKLAVHLVIDKSTPLGARGDPTRVRQILLNLVGNALKFTSQGSITITTSLSEGNARLRWEVSDTGMGISEQDKQKLFRPFSQVNGSISRQFGGTGLGLAICRKLVEQMNGSIGVESAPGHGSVFWFEIPYVPSDPPSPRLPERDAETMSPAQSTMPVLVVDDNETNRLVFTSFLKKIGYRSESAVNGREALELIARHRYCAILMDCQMPEMGGYETTRNIRFQEGTGPRTPIIGITAQALDGDKEKVLASGMDDYLPKPVQLEDLASRLSRWVQKDPTDAPASPGKNDGVVDETVWDQFKELRTPDGKNVLEKVLTTFIKTMPEYVGQIKTMAAQEDLEQLTFPAHTLKGSSRTIGAERMGRICSSILEAASPERKGNLPSLVAQLEVESTLLTKFIEHRLLSFKS